MKTTLLILSLLVGQLLNAQSISSYLHERYKFNTCENCTEIVETTTHYSKTGPTTTVEYDSYDTLMNQLSLKRFDDENKLIFLVLNYYDSLNRLVRVETKKWVNIVGYQSNYSVRQYDTSKNFVQTEYNDKYQMLNISKYYFDRDTNLIRLEAFAGNGKLIGYETGVYDFDNNLLTLNHYNSQSVLLNSHDRPIRYGGKFQQDPTNEYNEHGDLVYYKRDWHENDIVCYTMKYKYDKQLNWISEKRYQHIISEKGKLKGKKINMVRTRKIQYIHE